MLVVFVPPGGTVDSNKDLVISMHKRNEIREAQFTADLRDYLWREEPVKMALGYIVLSFIYFVTLFLMSMSSVDDGKYCIQNELPHLREMLKKYYWKAT